MVLDQPGPTVAPPVKIEVEFGKEVTHLEELKKEIEALLNSRLNFRAAINLVPEGSLPRFEMKAQLIKKLWEPNNRGIDHHVDKWKKQQRREMIWLSVM